MPSDAAAPPQEIALDAVAETLVQPEYVYFCRVVVETPIANIPNVALPAAAPANDAEVDDVAAAFVSLEYVYLLRVVCGFGPQQEQTAPNAKIPTVALPVAAPPYVASLAAVADALVQPE